MSNETIVTAVPKVNGFMGAVTKYQGALLYSTTGSLDSPFTKLAEKHISELNTSYIEEGNTYLFEVCDEGDPHIVKENIGAHLLGVRCGITGKLLHQDLLAYEIRKKLGGHHTVLSTTVGKFGDIKEDLLTSKKEGFMILDKNSNTLCKLKTPHYLSKKAIMRLGKGKIDFMYNHTEEFLKRVDEEFYGLVRNIPLRVDIEVWKGYTEYQRRSYIEAYFYGN